MLDLQLLVGLLHPTQLLQLGRDSRIDIHTLDHDRALARLFAPTRQHEGMDVKRGGDILHLDARELTEAYGSGLELLAVASGRSRTWLGHGALLKVRSGCPLNRGNYRVGLNE